MEGKMSLRLHAISWEADRIIRFEMRHPAGDTLPPASPGDHVVVGLASGIARSYSLLEAAPHPKSYKIAVLHALASRGGSKELHERVRVGDVIEVGAPQSSFPLATEAEDTVFIAGGIGVTPFLSMAARLAADNRCFALHYFCRDSESAGFEHDLTELGSRVYRHYSRVNGAKRLSVADLVAGATRRTHLYCCGPRKMMAAFDAATVGRDPAYLHTELFAPLEEKSVAGGFLVELARSGRVFAIAPGETILDRLLDEGVNAVCSCREGVCGQCETRVLAGIPDHRDGVLTPQEREAGRSMMICCSGSKSSKIVLDI
jgi:tetrachlorobenzoquinone reductase